MKVSKLDNTFAHKLSLNKGPPASVSHYAVVVAVVGGQACHLQSARDDNVHCRRCDVLFSHLLIDLTPQTSSQNSSHKNTLDCDNSFSAAI